MNAQGGYDLHTHTAYSDGYDMVEMARAAEDAGLRGIGFTDHCLPYDDLFGRRERYDFVETYERRREEIRSLDVNVAVFDAVELNYDPNYASAVEEFLAEADFDYAIGSVHYVDDCYLARPRDLEGATEATKREIVESYVDWQVRLVTSGLVDVLGHLDLPQRSPSLRGVMAERDYERLAEALATSETVPEINAGRLDRSYGTVHPDPDYLHVFRDAGVPFVVGSDAHAPDQLRERNRRLGPLLEEFAVDIVDVPR